VRRALAWWTRRRHSLVDRLAGRVGQAGGDLVDVAAGWCARQDAERTWRMLDELRISDQPADRSGGEAQHQR
jgi:hypothetical protein